MKSTKQQLLESAAVLFSERGYANTPVSAICRRAGANIAAVNYHFQSKKLLYQAVLQYTFQQAEAQYPLDIDPDAAIEDQLYQSILVLLQRILSKNTKGNFYKLLAKEMAEPTTASGTIINEILSRKRARFQGIIRQAYDKAADEELLFRMTHSIVSQCLFLGLHEKGRSHHLKRKRLELRDAESFARHITDFSLAGVRCYRQFSGGGQCDV